MSADLLLRFGPELSVRPGADIARNLAGHPAEHPDVGFNHDRANREEACVIGEAALQVNRLRKSYGDVVALDDVSFSIPWGQAVAVIGPNGAGKTTLVESIVNLRRPDSGAIYVGGVNVADQPAVVAKIGVQLQEATLFSTVKVSRYFDLFRKLYDAPPLSPEILEQLGLSEHLGKRYADLSGGLKQRFSLALALLNDPKILILDEPTTGLDPLAREELWSFLSSWVSPRRALLLTSHFMEEVERLCSRVIVLANQKVVADGDVSSLLVGMPPSVKTLHAAYGRLVKAEV